MGRIEGRITSSSEEIGFFRVSVTVSFGAHFQASDGFEHEHPHLNRNAEHAAAEKPAVDSAPGQAGGRRKSIVHGAVLVLPVEGLLNRGKFGVATAIIEGRRVVATGRAIAADY